MEALAERFGIIADSTQPTFLSVARALYRELQLLPPFTLQTRQYVSKEAVAVLQAFKTAPEPDNLIIETLPVLLGCLPFPASGKAVRKDAYAFASELANVLMGLKAAYGHLLEQIWEQVAEATGVWGSGQRSYLGSPRRPLR